MKQTVIFLSILTSFASLANNELYCKGSDSKLIPMSDEEKFYENCSAKMYVKDAASFTGSRKKTKALLEELNEWEKPTLLAYTIKEKAK